MSASLKGQMVFLGTGTSVGVPTIGCDCAVCTSTDPRNNRLRCSVVLGLPEGNLLIDTPPDLRTQLLRERISMIHAVAFTHAHADHLFGLDDVRLFPFRLGHPIPLYCEEAVERQIRQAYDYAFAALPETHPGAVPRLQFRRIATEPFSVLGTTLIPIRFQHGPRFEVLGFRCGRVAYCTDVKTVPEKSWDRLRGLKTLVLDVLRERPHATHLNLEEALGVVERVAPERVFLTHLSHEMDHAEVESRLPPHIRLAYDGLRIPLE